MQADYIIDRIKMQKKISFWRVIAALAIFIIALNFMKTNDVFKSKQSHIARVMIDDVITFNYQIPEHLKKLATNNSVKAVIIHINSPGGSPVASQIIYNKLRAISKANKPVVAVIDEIAASGGYMAALGADHIIANENSIVGSVGVISMHTEITEAADKVGIKLNVLKTSRFKAAPNSREKLTPEVEMVVKEQMGDIFANFTNIVTQRRKPTEQQKPQIFSGKVFIGPRALNLGLIDALGDDETAMQWLKKTHNISEKTPIIDMFFDEERMDIRQLILGMSNLINIFSYNNKLMMY